MEYIDIDIKNKIATARDDDILIDGNEDYTVRFTFDEEWDDYQVKTARFTFGRSHIDVVFKGENVLMPKIAKATSVGIGVYAGNLKASTAAVKLRRKSILSEGGLPPPPPPDVYAQIMEMMNNLSTDSLTFDSTPTEGSSNPVTSDGIYQYCKAIQDGYITTDEVVYMDGGRISAKE